MMERMIPDGKDGIQDGKNDYMKGKDNCAL